MKLQFHGKDDDLKKKNHFHGKIKDIFNFVLQLSTVTLSFFETLVGLNCEDVMLWLIFRHLIPQTAFLPSQKSTIRHPDIHGRGAEKLLQLTPICCLEAKTPGSLNGFNHMTSSPASHSGMFQKLVKNLIDFVFHEKFCLFFQVVMLHCRLFWLALVGPMQRKVWL